MTDKENRDLLVREYINATMNNIVEASENGISDAETKDDILKSLETIIADTVILAGEHSKFEEVRYYSEAEKLWDFITSAYDVSPEGQITDIILKGVAESLEELQETYDE